MPNAARQHAAPLLVTAAVIIQHGKVLLTKRPAHKPHGGLWEFPGGKLDPDESPVQALTRELDEELALQIEVGQILDVLYHVYDRGPVLILAYRCTITSGTPRNIEVEEHRWVALENLCLYPILPADKPLIAKLSACSE